MEKVIHEFRIIETDDGFRIEIKGDKERIKSFMPGFGSGRGPRGHGRHRHGPWGPFAFGFGPWMGRRWDRGCWEWDVEEGEPKEQASEV